MRQLRSFFPVAAGPHRTSAISVFLAALLGTSLTACAPGDDGPACVPDDCRARCRSGGYEDGVCNGSSCECVAGGDADGDRGDDVPADVPVEDDGSDGNGDAPADESGSCPAWSDVEMIFLYNCARCHSYLRSYDGVRSNLSIVRAYVQLGHYISGDQRDLVLQWIDCGGPP